MFGKSFVRLVAAGFCMFAAGAWAADSIKVAHIDPQSGPFALQGQSGDRRIQQAIDEINARGGVLGGAKLELVSLDNKSSPQESLVALKQAIDQGIRYVTQGNGSHVAHALTDAILKHKGIDAEVAQHLLKVGQTSVTTLVQALQGKAVPANVDTGTDLVTEDNATAYLQKAAAESK